MGIFEALTCWIPWLAAKIKNAIIESIEFVLTIIFNLVNAALSLLPSDPTDGVQQESGMSNALDWANYLLPIGPLFAEFTLIMTAWILYRLYQWLFGFAKADY